MDNLEEAVQGMLQQLDRFTSAVRQVLAEEAPVGTKTERVTRLREDAFSGFEATITAFEQSAQEREKELLAQMAHLRHLRDQVTVLRHGILPMFATQPRRD